MFFLIFSCTLLYKISAKFILIICFKESEVFFLFCFVFKVTFFLFLYEWLDFIYLFIFGCVGSSFLCEGFL